MVVSASGPIQLGVKWDPNVVKASCSSSEDKYNPGEQIQCFVEKENISEENFINIMGHIYTRYT